MERDQLWVIVAVAMVVAVLSSIITANITGDVIRVSPVTGGADSTASGTEVYTKAEIDSKLNAVYSQITVLTNSVSKCCVQTGTLSVTSSPTSANIYVDGSYKGLTPLTVTGLSIGNHPVQITKTGYNTFSTTKNIIAGSNSLFGNLTPVTAQTGTLSVTSSPNAYLYVDGTYKGATPLTVTGLSVGNHAIQISRSGYNTFSTTKYIIAGSNSVFGNLTPVTTQTGTLTVTSSPTSANIYVDGSYKGLTPLTVTGLSVGNHAVQITKTGYNTFSTTKNIIAGSNSVFGNLTPVIAQTGTLSVTSSPTSANIYVDGSYKGLTPLTVTGLSVGNHPVQITKTGYNTFSNTKSVYAGSNSLHANLTPAQTGTLSVTSNPSSANTYVDGTYKGLTPITVAGLSVGNHLVQVSKTGYDLHNTTKYVYAGSNYLSANLTPETGTLSVTSSPSSANIYVDGSYKGLTPLTVARLSVGNHFVQITKTGYNMLNQTKYVYAGSNYLFGNMTPVNY